MKKIALLSAILLISVTTFAQRHEFGVFLGGSYYIGDLNPTAHFLNTRPGGGLTYRYTFNSRWALRVNGFYGQVVGDDAVNPDQEKVDRNLYFKSNVVEIGSTLEFNFLKFVPGGTRDRFTPYLFGGLAVFRFNPMAEYNGDWYELQPLGTEGQGTTEYPDRDPYALTTVSMPFGLGIKWSIGRNVVLGAEYGLRKTFTDYLDDVSKTYADPFTLYQQNTPAAMIFGNRVFEDQAGNVKPIPGETSQEDLDNYAGIQSVLVGQQRGDEGTKDWYSFFGITLTFKIKGAKAGKCPAYQNHYYYKEYHNR